MHRTQLKETLKLWYKYGMAHSPLVKAHAKKYLEIVFQFAGKCPQYPIISFPFSFKGFIYLGDFHLMHLWLLLAIIGYFTQSFLLFSSSLLLFVIFGFRFFRFCFRIEPYDKWVSFCKIKYLTNLYFVLGGLKNSIKNKTITIEPSF